MRDTNPTGSVVKLLDRIIYQSGGVFVGNSLVKASDGLSLTGIHNSFSSPLVYD